MDTSPVGRTPLKLRLVAVGALALLAVGVTSGSAPANAQAAPTLTAISPNSGPEAGGSNVTLTGTNLDPDASITTVTFGPNQAPSVDCSDDTTCVVQTPPGTGTVDVVISNANGTSNAVQFTYIPPLRLLSANPTSAPPGDTITFTGTGFSTAPGATQFDAAQLVFFVDESCSSTTTCTAVVPACNPSTFFPFEVTVNGVLAQAPFESVPGFTCTGGAGVGSSDGGGDLAGTGTSTTTLALLGAVMFGAGGWSLVLATRRRSANR